MRFFVLFAASAMVGCVFDCDVDGAAHSLAGAGAVDCGQVAIEADTTSAVQCALDAQAAGKAFFLHIDRHGTDSQVFDVYVRTPDGASTHYLFDSAGTSTGTSEVARAWKIPCDKFEKSEHAADRQTGTDLTCVSPGTAVAECG